MISNLMSELVENYVSVNWKAMKKGSMVAKLPRHMCDKIGKFGVQHPKDIRGMVDIGVEATKSLLERDRNTYRTFGTDAFLLEWMNEFVKYLIDRLDGNFRNMRTLRDDVIIPVFKSEIIRSQESFTQQMREWKTLIGKYRSENEDADKDEIIKDLNVPVRFNFLLKKEEK